jgi:Trk K+ transport system NAD-binding subunit
VAKGSDLDRVTSIVLREMRPPLLVLVVVYSLGIGVMVLIPGVDGAPMGLFHAFYFMTYTATTTGFGELPREFSDPQRLWAAVCLYMSVIAWVYAIGTIISKVQNPHFTLALAQARFARAVGRINDPFFIICGFGDTGSLLARGLSDRRMTAVIIDSDVERIKALDLRDYMVPMPGLEGDASVPKNLQDAGVGRPNCKGVVLLTGDEDVNLKIAVMVRLLNPDADVICRSKTRSHEEELKGLGSVVVIDPFETWARELGLALHQPPLHTLDEWLVGAHGVTLEQLISYPRGTWVLCGYGKLGKSLHQSLQKWGVHTVVIDPHIEAVTEVEHGIAGLATRANLIEAGVAHAAGIVAATNSDSDNLAILLTARNLNADVHLIVRQNHHENELAFSAASADLIMQPSLVTARRLLLQLISPLIQELLDHLEEHPDFLRDVVFPRLRANVGARDPALWTLHLNAEKAPAAVELFRRGGTLELSDLIRDAGDREETLACVPLVLRRGEQRMLVPDDDLDVRLGDEILMCSTRAAQAQIKTNLVNVYTLEYLVTGTAPTRGYAMSWLVGTARAGRLRPDPSASSASRPDV